MAIPFLNNIDLSDNQLLNAKLQVTSPAPTAAAGQIYYNSVSNIAQYYNGTAWVELIASAGGTVTSIGTATAGTIAIAGTSAIPTVSTVTAAVVNAGTALATGDQIYDFVTAQIANVPSGLSFEGSWNASTDTPTLAASTPANGVFYIVSVAGSTDLSGITDWEVGDWAIYVSDGAGTDAWQKVDNTSTLSGAGATNQVTYWTGAANVAGDAGMTYDPTAKDLNVGGDITADGTMYAGSGNSTEWDAGYNNSITGLSVTGTTTKTLTATQQDGGTLTAAWTDTDSGGTVTGVTGVSPILVTASPTAPAVSIVTATGAVIGAGNVAAGTGISVAYVGGTATVTNTETNSANTYAATITDTATITHSLSTRDLIIQLYDTVTYETVYADVDRISTSQATITFASTPTNSIRVLVQKIG
jgi:hypothetical protein